MENKAPYFEDEGPISFTAAVTEKEDMVFYTPKLIDDEGDEPILSVEYPFE